MLIVSRQVLIREVVVNVKVPKKVRDKIQPSIDAGICIIDDCEKPAVARGLCWNCRKAASAAVASGKYSEEDLIRDGMLLHTKRAGRKPANAFVRQLSDSTQ